jgi:hypothetical protein
LLKELTPEQAAALLHRRSKESLPPAEELPITASWNDGPRGRPTFNERALDNQYGNRDRDDRGPPPPYARDDRGPPMRDERGPPARRPRGDDGDGEGDGMWFHINVGRRKNADPKWLLPLICRRGGVQKKDIGRIVILDHETRFEINPALAGPFTAAAAKPDSKDPAVVIEPLLPSRASGPPPGRGGDAPRSDGPRSDGPRRPPPRR